MSETDSGLFEQITKRTLESGTADFFRSVLGIVVSFIGFSYLRKVPDPYDYYVGGGLLAFFLISLIYCAFCMISAHRRKPLPQNQQSRIEGENGAKGLPDLSREADDVFAKRTAEAWAKIQSAHDSSRS